MRGYLDNPEATAKQIEEARSELLSRTQQQVDISGGSYFGFDKAALDKYGLDAVPKTHLWPETVRSQADLAMKRQA